MAHLNVRERVLETKIAFVDASGFAALGDAEVIDNVLALTWKPSAETTFRDCGVRVRVVAPRGEASKDQLAALLRDADGVVFSDEKHRALFDGFTKTVVQVAEWEGVTQTLERALADVLTTLQRETLNDDTMVTDTARSNGRATAREGNPLLTALRQVLRETVTAEVDELESRVTHRLEGFFAEQRAEQRAASAAVGSDERSDERADEQAATIRRLADETAQLRQTMTQLQASVTALQTVLRASAGEVSQTRRAVDGIATSVTTSVVPEVQKVAAALTAEVHKEMQKGARIDQIEALVKRELLEATNAVARRVDRTSETQAAAIAQTNHAVLGTDAKTQEIRLLLEAMIEELKKPKKGWFT